MSTFSEIVDEVANTSGMKTNIPAVIGFVNRAMKRLTPMHHYSDLVEWRTHVSPNSSYSLTLPMNHRTTRVVRIDGRIYAKRKPPGLVQAVTTDASHYYYEAGLELHISGRANRVIDVAYYRVTPSMKYYPEEYRLLRSAVSEANAEFGYETRLADSNDWMPLDINTPVQFASFERHVNWITKNYSEILVNGALSHAYNSKGETERGSRLFQIFTNDVSMIEKAHQDLMVGQQ